MHPPIHSSHVMWADHASMPPYACFLAAALPKSHIAACVRTQNSPARQNIAPDKRSRTFTSSLSVRQTLHRVTLA
eukprot:4855132-Amphidinium_carterae.1